MYEDGDIFLDKEKKVFKRPEIQRLYHLHNIKKYFGETKTEIKLWSEFEKLEQTAKLFYEKNIPFFIMNNPENPLELELYSNSNFYKTYLEFLKKLTVKYPNVKFFDYKDKVSKKQFFIDSHHLTYNGAKEYTNYIYKNIIQPNLFGEKK